MKQIYILIILVISSCTYNDTILYKNNASNFLKHSSFNDSTLINLSDKPKVFFSIDVECPLCVSYSKKINEIYEEYNKDVDFYAFLPSIVFSEIKTENSNTENMHGARSQSFTWAEEHNPTHSEYLLSQNCSECTASSFVHTTHCAINKTAGKDIQPLVSRARTTKNQGNANHTNGAP